MFEKKSHRVRDKIASEKQPFWVSAYPWVLVVDSSPVCHGPLVARWLGRFRLCSHICSSVGPRFFFHEKRIKDEIVQVCRSLRMWHQMIWFVRIFVLDFQLWLWFWQLTAKAQPKEEGRADRTLPELQEEAICWMYLTKTTIWYPFHNPCGKWSVEVSQSLESHSQPPFSGGSKSTKEEASFRCQNCQPKNGFGEILRFFYSTPNWRTCKKLPCVQDLRIAWWTCLSVDGFVYWLWNLWMFLLTHLHLYTQVPPMTFFNGETMSKIWNEITWTIWMYLNWYLNCIPTLGPLIPKQNDTQDPHPQVIGSLRSCCWEEPGRSLHQPRNLGWKFWNRGYNLIQKKHWGE